MKNGKLRVALVGVSFGAEFVPIYLKHPDVDSLVLVDTNKELLNTVGDKFLLEERLTDFNAMLEDKTIDAVHLVTPPATHAPLSIQVMNAGKHCACTIPMGMSIDELYQVIDARKKKWEALHVYGDLSLWSRVSVRKESLRKRRTGQNTIHALCALSGHGRMAGLLAGLSSTDASYPRGSSLPDVARQASGNRILQGLRQST